MTKFAKLFELDQDSQVLLTLDYNNEKNIYEVNVRTDINGISVVATLGFEKKAKAIESLKKYNKKNAEEFRINALEMFLKD